MKRIVHTLILLVSIATQTIGQEMVFSTEPAARKVGISDPFEVKYVIKNPNRVNGFDLPEMKDFQVLQGPSQRTNHSWVNGKSSVTLELIYVFKAKRIGMLTIQGGIISVDGREYKSNNVNIEVIQGSVMARNNRQQQDPFATTDPFDDPFFNQMDPFGDEDDIVAAIQKQRQQMQAIMKRHMQQNSNAHGMYPDELMNNRQPEIIKKEDLYKNIFIKVDVDKRDVYLGEQITATYKLCSRVRLDANITKLPKLVGFWSQDFEIRDRNIPKRETIDGKEYLVFEIKKTALFPTRTGTLELDTTQAEGVAQLNYENIPIVLKSNPVKINVRPLPDGSAYKGFNGAVGNYTIESNIDKTELTTDDVVNLTYRIRGTGNLKLIESPQVNVSNNFDQFDPQISDTITNTNNVIAGYKTFMYSFAPRKSGTLTIPSTDFTYFDPENSAFKTLMTPSYTLNVKPGNADKVSDGKLPRDIHDIHSTHTKLSKLNDTLILKNPLYWGGFGAPILAYIGFLFFRKREEDLQSNTVLFKNKKANKIALLRLATAERYLKQTNQSAFYEETSKAVWLYLSDKLNIPLSNLSKEVATEKLKEKTISSELQNELFRITNECEMALYSPDRGAMMMHQTYSDAFKLIGKLEENLS